MTPLPTLPNPDPTAALRRACYLLVGVAAVSIAAAKVVGAENVWEPSRFQAPTPASYGADRDADTEASARKPWPAVRPEPTPMFGSNDRSRWATVRALVDEGTYRIGRRENFRDKKPPFRDGGIIFENGWESVDKVMDPDTGVYYSSKPPLLPTVAAGEYWLLKHLLGWDINRDKWWVVGSILLTLNVFPFAAFLVVLARVVEEYGATDFGRLLTFATGCFATALTTFSPTFNNHTPAICCTLFAVAPLLRRSGEPGPAAVAASGFFAGLLVTLEFQAAALLAGLLVPLLWARPGRALLVFLPAAAAPILAHFALNYLALGELSPAYSKFGGPWYNYPGSHWAKLGTHGAKGIDFAREPKLVYAFHLLFGHHGWFSLTPVWLLAAWGLGRLSGRAVPDLRARLADRTLWPFTLPVLGLLSAAVSAVVLAFYLVKTNNYGGGTSGPRWLFWVAPLWLLGLLPAADKFAACGRGRAIAATLFGLSVFAAFYPAWNPWRLPWVGQLFDTLGWIRY